MKAQREGKVNSFFNFGAKWGWDDATPRPLYPGKETRYPLYKKPDGPQGQSGRVRKNLAPPPTGIRSLGRPASSELLY